MPIIIDASSQDALDQQMKDASQAIAKAKTYGAKHFSKNMTGNGKRKSGLFGTDSDSFVDFMQNKRRLLGGDVMENEAMDKALARHEDQTFGNHFHQSAKPTQDRFRLFENNLTTVMPPVIFFDALNQNTPVALSVPKSTKMYHLDTLESNWYKLEVGLIDGKPATTYIKPVIQSMRLYAREEKQTSKSGIQSTDKKTSAQADIYILVATTLDDMSPDGDMVFVNERKLAKRDGTPVNAGQGVVSIYQLREATATTFNYSRILHGVHAHQNLIGNASVQMNSVTILDVQDTLENMLFSKTLDEQATLLATHAPEILATMVKVIAKHASSLKRKRANYKFDVNRVTDSMLITFVQHIDTLNDIQDDLITTDLLAELYESLNAEMHDVDALNRVARHSLRLLLSQRLHQLNAVRAEGGLYQFDPQDVAVTQAMQANPNYSLQQKRIIMSTDPLVIGQAGAGSGKSHTLVGRIGYMREQGEDLSKVLVLSFTNVAAINITNRFPGVRSETLANMFHTIYSGTFPAQTLSQPSTVANALRLLNTNSAYFANLGFDPTKLGVFCNQLAERLEQFDQTGFKRVNVQQELKRLSHQLEGLENLKMAAALLDAVEQTTLEIEPIIIHHMLLSGNGTLNIPDAYKKLNYIITDESQDISTFEYILLLELTIHYRSQLLIIGDGSQTLYEFRNSDPRYMNALESSNVFVSHKLETNYRSNEEILMFANQFLQVIDANKYANIQLKSSRFSTPTEQSVKDAITVVSNPIMGAANRDYVDSVVEFMQNDTFFQDWFIDRVKKGEQVAIMGWTRKEVLEAGAVIEQLLATHGLNVPVTNIMSNNEPPMTILSRFVRAKSEMIRSLDPTNVHYLDDIRRHAAHFVSTTFGKASMKQAAFYEDIIVRTVRDLTNTPLWNAWIADFKAGNLNAYQIGSQVIQEIFRAETRRNAMDNYLRKQKDTPNYDECKIILSTIHGTKGLEFDHTVVLFNEAKRGSTSQESLRMMFVALSRAKKSEFILNSHSPSKTRVVSDTHTGMTQTPISSAYLRTLNAVRALQQGVTPNGQAPVAVAAGVADESGEPTD